MKVELKSRPINDGLISLYLEYYLGYSKVNGKIKHKRKQEKLELVLFTSPKNNTERQKNKEANETAQKILTIRQAEIIESKHSFLKPDSNILLTDYFMKLAEERKSSKSNYGNWISAYKHIVSYLNRDFNPDSYKLSDVDDDFIKGFKSYLDNEELTKSSKQLSNNSKLSYLMKLRACIREAFNNKLIDDNPFNRIKGFKTEETKREYLTLQEIQSLANKDCRYPILKKAFLFSCMTGLRWSDINKMKWSEIKSSNGEYKYVFNQQKTNQLEYLPLSNQAMELLGRTGKSDDRVFKGLRYNSYFNTELQRWVLKAGITKTITFHCARHSFATLQLTYGTDLFTVSKLLGHKNISTTQIYSKVIDQKKIDAVNKIPLINLN